MWDVALSVFQSLFIAQDPEANEKWVCNLDV